MVEFKCGTSPFITERGPASTSLGEGYSGSIRLVGGQVRLHTRGVGPHRVARVIGGRLEEDDEVLTHALFSFAPQAPEVKCADGSVLTGLGCFNYDLQRDERDRSTVEFRFRYPTGDRYAWGWPGRGAEEFCSLLMFTCTFFDIKIPVVQVDIGYARGRPAGDFDPLRSFPANRPYWLSVGESTFGYGEKNITMEGIAGEPNKRRVASAASTRYGEWTFSESTRFSVSGVGTLSDTGPETKQIICAYRQRVAEVIASTERWTVEWPRVCAGCSPAETGARYCRPGSLVFQQQIVVTDGGGSTNTILTRDHVCVPPGLPPPVCTPANCGNPLAIEIGGIGPGCQCCKAGSPEVANGAPACVVDGPKSDRLIAMANAAMSSQYTGGSVPYPAANCLTDSNAHDSMCITALEDQPWWAADTADGLYYDISTIVVRNRADCTGTTTPHGSETDARGRTDVHRLIADGATDSPFAARARTGRLVHGPPAELPCDCRRRAVQGGRRGRASGLPAHRLRQADARQARPPPAADERLPQPPVRRRGGEQGP